MERLKNKEGLLRAAELGFIEEVKQLVDAGVSVNIQDECGKTPLYMAAARGHVNLVDYICSIPDCDINLKAYGGITPVLIAARYGYKDVVLFLLHHGAKPDTTFEENCTLLHEVCRKGWVDVAQFILDSHDLDLNVTGYRRWTPLQLAAFYGHEEVASLLIRTGADVNHSDVEGLTALHFAAIKGNFEVVQTLLQREGLHLDPRDVSNDTPLFKACLMGHRKIVRQLLEAGANPNIRNYEGKTALIYGIEGHIKLTMEEIKLFVKKGAYFKASDYNRLYLFHRYLKEVVLKDVGVCTQLIVNEFHCQSLPALYGIPHLAQCLPPVKNMHLSDSQTRTVTSFVESEIEANTFCNVLEMKPMVLQQMCVLSLLASLS